MDETSEEESEGASLPLDPTEQAAALREANERLVLATMRAQAAEDELREAALHKDQFLAMLGHELRNPLVPIRNTAEVLHRVAARLRFEPVETSTSRPFVRGVDARRFSKRIAWGIFGGLALANL